MRREVESRLLVVACVGLIVGIAGNVHLWNLLFLVPLLLFLRPPAAKAAAAVACLVGAVVALIALALTPAAVRFRHCGADCANSGMIGL